MRVSPHAMQIPSPAYPPAPSLDLSAVTAVLQEVAYATRGGIRAAPTPFVRLDLVAEDLKSQYGLHALAEKVLHVREQFEQQKMYQGIAPAPGGPGGPSVPMTRNGMGGMGGSGPAPGRGRDQAVPSASFSHDRGKPTPPLREAYSSAAPARGPRDVPPRDIAESDAMQETLHFPPSITGSERFPSSAVAALHVGDYITPDKGIRFQSKEEVRQRVTFAVL